MTREPRSSLTIRPERAVVRAPQRRTWPAESRTFADERTGARVRQVTSHASIHHHPFYYLPAYDDAMQRLVFVSHRTGRPEVFAELRDTDRLLQLTDHADLAEWSVHPSHDGRFVYFTDSHGGWRVDCDSLSEECLLEFNGLTRESGMIGAAMGTTSMSHDDRFWAIALQGRLIVCDTSSGSHETILERDTVAHPEFHPSDNTLLRYGGPYHSRLWVIRRDGTGNRLVYQRTGKQWIVHETWRPGTHEIITTNWPHGCFAIDVITGATRQVCTFNAWHPSITRDGALMCADTTCPDRGLQLFDPRDGIGAPRMLCESRATNQGEHWNTDHCPYDDGPVSVYAPQHTHPHPSFSPDGRRVVFTSDRGGIAQVYEVEL
jgi:oligogalacturonide lyase